MRIGIDASNVGGGGGITHLKELLCHYDEKKYENEISQIIVYASQMVLDNLADSKIVTKKTFPEFNKGLLARVIFQLTKYDKVIEKDCDILLSVTGDYIGKFKPLVGMSRNMLLYERSIWKEIGQFKEVVRFWLNFHKQKKSFRNSAGIIFISNYAKSYIGKVLDLKKKKLSIVHHGVSLRFLKEAKKHKSIESFSEINPFKLVYVSPVHVYKHQWNVVKAVNLLREKYPVHLTLIGGVIFEPAGKKMLETINEVDPDNTFITYKGHVGYEEIDQIYDRSNGLIFASTCENMPNTLLECMSSGVAIACSNKEPMPEFLKENGYYFDSYNVDSIANSIEKMILNPDLNDIFASNNLAEVKRFNWKETTEKTFDIIISIYKEKKCAV